MTTPDHTLDAAVRAAAEPFVDGGEAIVGWVVLCGTRNFRDGGGVIVLPSEAGMPPWLAKGIVVEALDDMRRGGGLVTYDTDGGPDDIGPDVGDDFGGHWPAA